MTNNLTCYLSIYLYIYLVILLSIYLPAGLLPYPIPIPRRTSRNITDTTTSQKTGRPGNFLVTYQCVCKISNNIKQLTTKDYFHITFGFNFISNKILKVRNECVC